MIQAALDGAGRAWVTEDRIAQHLESGALIRVLEDWCPPFPGLFLYYPTPKQQPAALTAHPEQTARERRNGRWRRDADLVARKRWNRRDGRQCAGVIQLRLETGEHLVYQALAADLPGDGSVRLTVRRLPGGGPSDELDVVLIRPDTAIGECLIYDIVGPDVRVDAPGTITVK